MKRITVALLGALVFANTTGCILLAKPAIERVQERLSLVDDYEKCVKKAGEDNAKIEACDSYLREAEAIQ